MPAANGQHNGVTDQMADAASAQLENVHIPLDYLHKGLSQ